MNYKTVDGIKRIQNELGSNKISAVGTITYHSINRAKEIVKEYINNGLNSIFFRPVSNYGFAGHKNYKSINKNDYNLFFNDLKKEIKKLDDGFQLQEINSQIRLEKIYNGKAFYADLVSPTAHGTGVLLFNYDGKVYGSDESRMLAEMYDEDFSLGSFDDVFQNNFNTDLQEKILSSSFIEFNPGCTDCAYQPYCGSDPIYHLMTQGDFVGNKNESEFTAKKKYILRTCLMKYFVSYD